MSVLLAVHTVIPVNGFEAHEFTTLGVATSVFVMLVPSTLTAATPVTRNNVSGDDGIRTHDPLLAKQVL